MQPNGATVWARKTIQSEIFATKPDKWFKIWFYIVNRVNYKDNTWKRGECFISSGEIERVTGATKDQVKKCLSWLRDEHSVSTRRSTRGIHITVIKYNVYQDLGSYSSTREAPEKHHDSRRREIRNNNSEANASARSELPDNLSDKKDNEKDVMFNTYSDDHFEGEVDYDGDGALSPVKKPNTRKYPNAPAVRKLFQEILGRSEANWRINKNQLQACENLYTERGMEKIKNALEFYQENKDQEFCPVIDSPCDLDSKYAKLSRFKTKL